MFSDRVVDARNLLGLGEYDFRLQPLTLTPETASLDNSDPAKVAALKEIGRRCVDSESAALHRIATLWLRQRPAECRREPASVGVS